ncbi:hypothetical protein MSIMFB_03353 [Mycobacterium simulans]|uniref:Uncharacterized protein n=1 Tax=Mycobacterium simulans TaxID=627089 RepID=A0A7Z7IME3_9MYCO|nr:hypothetical protein [Mycobacterium simulans]SOJ55874.1 hypothetical protein MSIMFB_03353 [Mycobacterium simulans]
MSTKREGPKRRGSDRRSGRDGSARSSRRTGLGTKADSASSRRTRKTTAPTKEARTPQSGPQTSPIPRPVDRPARPKNTSQAKARAKARKAKAPKVVRPKLTERVAARLASIDLRPRTIASKVPFVVLVIGSLGVGLGLTLWLSTDAAERSYQLSHARERTRMLQQQKEALERDVREAQSAPALAEAARKQGMIPTRDTAHLVQAPDGNWVVVGTPKPADGVPPPPLNTKLPEEGPPPPPKPPAPPPEVPVRLSPGPGDPPAPARPGPQLLLRAPDGSSTLGADPHLATQVPGQLPVVPGVVPGVPGQLPVVPGVQLPVVPGVVPGQLPAPVNAAPPLSVHVPAEVPAPLQAGTVPQAPGVPPLAPVAPQPTALPPALMPVPANGEQFTPVIAPEPGAPQ